MSQLVGFPCYGCQHHREVPGNAHIQCVAAWVPSEVAAIMRSASAHGKRQGWFYFPFVYDPIWAREWDDAKAGPVECARFLATTPEPEARQPEPRRVDAGPWGAA